ncbi:TPA: hypothetical protein ACUU9M_004200 [Yersinia enterocolitica]|uniref:Uncharacterized protein n=1 Tax=Yersinia kristensenii TaxID=28152 RepID=A0AB73P1B7_YERKR|nr:hypothetical protein [Yersinia kristensenii]OVZ78410.1 hypothetical protein CBW52_18870 [Yersinia kristensenii]HEB0973852.1 hypothetical protein [Yersinia enterocolitica]HEB1850849.1 hypothetical protein [Yersinia enterocolitica]
MKMNIKDFYHQIKPDVSVDSACIISNVIDEISAINSTFDINSNDLVDMAEAHSSTYRSLSIEQTRIVNALFNIPLFL